MIDHEQAEVHLQEILTVSRAEERIHQRSLAHLLLGRVKIAQNRLAAAGYSLRAGLHLGWTHKLTLVATQALVCFAELYDAQNDPIRALGLLTVALNHPATEKRDKLAAARHLSTLSNKLSSAVFEKVAAQGADAIFEEVVAQILDDSLGKES